MSTDPEKRAQQPPNATSRRRDLPFLTPFAGGCLVGGLVLGVLLRWYLAGRPLPAGQFGFLRQAHSHLGYYGVLFPLAWVAWRRLEAPVPGRMALALYAVATVVSVVGFALQGYAALSIAGSTVVLGVWLLSAWQVKHRALRWRDWLGSASPAIVLSAIAIPGVAVTIDTHPEFARELVQGFLTLLLFGVIAPSALATIRAPRPPAPLWLLGVLGAGLSLGPFPMLLSDLALAWLGALVGVAGWNARAPLDLRLLWVGLGGALLLLGARILPERHDVAIAGIHYVILGPVLITLGRPLLPRLPDPLRVGYGALVGAFTLTVLLQAFRVPGHLPRVAGWLGTAIALCWLAGVVTRLYAGSSPTAEQPPRV